MQTESELAAALKKHQAKYPLKLGGMPMREWFALQEKAKRSDEKSDTTHKSLNVRFPQ